MPILQDSSPENCVRPLLMMDKFVKQAPRRTVSLFDVCSGSIEHINLKHVVSIKVNVNKILG